MLASLSSTPDGKSGKKAISSQSTDFVVYAKLNTFDTPGLQMYHQRSKQMQLHKSNGSRATRKRGKLKMKLETSRLANMPSCGG